MLYRFNNIYKTTDNIEMHYTQELTSVFEHTHDFYEFCISLNDSAIHAINRKSIPLKKNEALFIYPTDQHEIDSRPNSVLSAFNISFRRTLFESCWKFYFGDAAISIPQIPITISERRLSEYQNLNAQFILMSEENKRFYEKKIALETIELFYKTNTIITNTFPEWLNNILASFKNPSNYSNFTGFEHIYQSSGYSKPQFNKLFKRYLNQTPIQFYNACKIEHACSLLLESNLDLQHICSRLGFSSTSHFIHLFKSFMHCTPLQYRKNHLT